jgi:hypothetical protein
MLYIYYAASYKSTHLIETQKSSGNGLVDNIFLPK